MLQRTLCLLVTSGNRLCTRSCGNIFLPDWVVSLKQNQLITYNYVFFKTNRNFSVYVSARLRTFCFKKKVLKSHPFEYVFCELKLHLKFQNPMRLEIGEKQPEEREDRERK